MKTNRQPCKDCPDRHVGCHTSCEKYARLREHFDKIRKARRRESELYDYTVKATLHSSGRERRF